MRRFILALCILCCGIVNLPAADDWSAVLEKNTPGIVRVSATVTVERAYAGQAAQKNDSRLELNGTVLDANGLIAVSLVEIDPVSLYQEMLENNAEIKSKVSVKSDISDLKIWLPGGQEIPGRLVYRDADLDLAFLVPVVKDGETQPTFTPISTTPSGELKLLDSVLTVTRMAKAFQRTPAVYMSQVSSVLRKPRLLYVCMNEGKMLVQGSPGTFLGTPAFTADGKFVGIWGMNKTGINGAISRQEMPQPIPVVLPATQVMESAKQARSAKEKPVVEKGDKPTSGTKAKD
ncbi:TPA: hypothetical protein DDW35_11005 [Candidatus Sumerlaeota bacterium]|nr:hypothetical protein [Candidatus Sumerlaeota bacterium]